MKNLFLSISAFVVLIVPSVSHSMSAELIAKMLRVEKIQRRLNDSSFIADEELIQFDREEMNEDKDYKVEGYWASDEDKSKDFYGGKYPWPQKNRPWKGRREFIEKLDQMEFRCALGDEKNFRWTYCGGPTQSRLISSPRFLGEGEFKDSLFCIKWPDSFLSHYVEQCNVKPSREFYRFVMNYTFKHKKN